MAPKHQMDHASPDVELSQPKRRAKMSDNQLQRKRASDREAQRNLREKTRNRVAHLENLVQSLRGNQEGRVECLISQLDEQRAEITRLKSALASISKIADAAKDAVESTASQPTLQRQSPPEAPNLGPECKSQVDVDEMSSDEAAFASNNVIECEASGMPGALPALYPLVGNTEMVEAHTDAAVESVEKIIMPDDDAVREQDSQALSIAQMASSIVRKRDLDGRFWFLAGTLLSYILKNKDGHPVQTAYDEDIAIRAVFEGWSSVIERYPLDRGWQWLKELDENIYFNTGPQHRLMHLRNTRLQLLHQLDPLAGWNHALPDFFAPRPSQQHIEHDPLLEHFPWPGFRERVLFSPRKFATNHFMEALRKNIHFLWPFDIHDLYVKNHATGLYSYSNALNRQMMDIRCYTANADFFAQFPELRQDIPQNGISLVSIPTDFSFDSDSPDSSEEDPKRYLVQRTLTA